MTADVIPFKAPSADLDPPPPFVPDHERNGPMEAVALIASSFCVNGIRIARNGDFATWFLGELWQAGYKVVPLDEDES